MLDIGRSVRFCQAQMFKRSAVPVSPRYAGPHREVVAVASAVIRESNRTKPADSVLRIEMQRREDLSRAVKREISAAVFAYYRWRGWLTEVKSTEARIERALELNERFRKNPFTLPEDALQRKAVPSWLADFMECPVNWLRSLQREPPIWLRARPGQARALAKKLDNCRLAKGTSLTEALEYKASQDLFVTAEFQAGEFEIQDISSQAVGWLCAPKPGESWWDVCAGEGGKLLHLADLMTNSGIIWATDRVEWRLEKLRSRAARAKCFNYQCAVWDGSSPPPFKFQMDGALVDAPCSGIGTWHRNPHARWTLTAEDIQELAEVQLGLLRKAATWVKPGGRLIYAVCTLSKAETVEVAEKFGRESMGFEPLDLPDPFGSGGRAARLTFWPQTVQGNGMFVAAWTRK